MNFFHRKLLKYLVPIFLFANVFFSSTIFAGGNKAFSASTRAASMGSAFVAVADDASAAFYNPAGLTQIKELAMLNDAVGIMPHSKYTNSTNGISEKNRQGAAGISTFVAKRMNQSIVLGLGVYSPFARVSRYPASRALMGYPFKSRGVEISLNPVAAFKLGKKLSFGLGPSLNFDYLSITLLGLKQKADGFDVSGVFSLLYEFTSRFKAGVTYHLPSYVKIKGHSRGYFFGVPASDSLTAKYRNPGYLDLGFAFQATDKLLLALSFGAEFWRNAATGLFVHANPALTNGINFNSRDSYDLRLGMEYKFKSNQAFRLGYSYLPYAMPPEGILPGILDFDINVFSAGYSYYYATKWRFDLGVEIAKAKDAVSQSTEFNPFVGQYRANLQTIWVGVNYQV